MDQIIGAGPLPSVHLGREIEQGRSSWAEKDRSGRWTVHGSSGDDRITVSEYTPPGTARHSSWETMKYLKVRVNQDVYLIPLDGRNAAKSVGIYAGAGNDSVFVDPTVTFPLTINGEAGNDYLKGGGGPNALLGGSGNDTLIGGRSDDLLLGGRGFDTIQGNGGRDMYGMSDLFRRLHEGRCCRPFPGFSDPPPSYYPPSPAPMPTPPSAPSLPPPVVQPAPVPVPPPPPHDHQRPQPPRRQPVKTPPKPQTPPRPPLSSLMANVDTHDEKGFKSGRDMTKNLLTALYESPAKFRQTLASISGKGEKDDAVASFARALLEAGPEGGRLLRSIPSSDLKTMTRYLSIGNSWSANKKGIMLLLSRMTGVTGPGTTGLANDPSANEFLRRYQGVL